MSIPALAVIDVQGPRAHVHQMLIGDPDLDQAALATDAVLTLEEFTRACSTEPAGRGRSASSADSVFDGRAVSAWPVLRSFPNPQHQVETSHRCYRSCPQHVPNSGHLARSFISSLRRSKRSERGYADHPWKNHWARGVSAESPRLRYPTACEGYPGGSLSAESGTGSTVLLASTSSRYFCLGSTAN